MAPALGRLIVQAAGATQVVVVTHSAALVEALAGAEGAEVVELTKDHGETTVAGQGLLSVPTWEWGSR